MAKVPHGSPGGAGGLMRGATRRPKLVASLAAWAFLASLLCLHRCGLAVRNCQAAAAAAQDEAEAQAVGTAVAAALARRGAAGGLSTPLPLQREPTAAERWPGLRGLSRETVEGLIRAPPGLHGRVTKGGLPANFMFLMAHLTDTDPQTREEGIQRTHGPAVYSWFAQAFTYDPAAGRSAAGLQSPIPACHFWADHKYRLLYVRNFKTAGTSISITLGQKELPMYCTHLPATCTKKCEGKQVCLENETDPARVAAMFANYTVFSFARNPWARALSSWHHVNKYGMQGPCQDSFEDWAALPSKYGAKCLGIRNCCKRRFGWLLEHTEPQAACLFDADGRPAVDFLGRVEHLDEDMQALVELVNSRLQPGVEPLRVPALPHWQLARNDLQNDTDALWRYYAGIYTGSKTALQDVRSYFHADFDLLRIPQPPEGGGS